MSQAVDAFSESCDALLYTLHVLLIVYNVIYSYVLNKVL